MRKGGRLALSLLAPAVILLSLLAVWLWWPASYLWLGSWFIPWAQSPGFGGAAAVVAAIIAYGAASRQRAQQRQVERKEQWWKRAEWALNATLSDDADNRTVGYQMLESLAESEYAAEHEADVIAAATARSIDEALGSEEDGDDETVDPPGGPRENSAIDGRNGE